MKALLPSALALTLTWAAAQASGAEPPRPAAQAPAPGQGLAGLANLSREIERLGQQVGAAQAAQRQAEAEAGREAREIDALKGQPQSVTRDLELQDRLARAQERAGRLSQGAAALRGLRARQDGLRRQLLLACDRVLADPSLLSAQRLEVLRLRAAQAEVLSAAGVTSMDQLGALAAASGEGQPDDPVLLRERADLLRDSADKVRRELQRLTERTTELSRRQRLRERASAVDDDLFAEQASSRRGAGNNQGSFEKGGNTPLADRANNPGEVAGPSPPAPGSGPSAATAPPPAPVLPATRSGLDPATLDLLRRGEASADPEVKLRALRRAQAELQRLMDQLGRRANQLDQRATELSRRK